MDKKEYIKVLTDQIRCKMARPAVAREIGDHIEDQTAAFMSEGMNRAEAETAAVKEMGNPVETGVELDRIHRPKMPWLMIGLIVILSALSCIFQFLLNREAVKAGAGVFFDSRRQIVFILLGILVMTGVCFADYTRIAARARELLIGLVLLLLLGRNVMGLSVNGAVQWIQLPYGQAVNILIVLMLTVPLYAAVLYRYRGQAQPAVLKSILWMIPGCFLALLCAGLWMVFILYLTYLIVCGTAVYRGWYKVKRKAVLIGTGVLPFAGAGLIWLIGKDYQRERLLFYLSSVAGADERYSDSWPYAMVYVKELLKNSRMFGGGNGIPDISNMPELSDFMLSGVAGYYGIFTAVLLGGALLFLLLRFLWISSRQRNQLGMLMGTGCAVVFLIEAGFYFLNNLGIVYLGNYCPFFSYGGTGTIVTYILLGILLSICRYQDTAPERKTAGSLFGIRRQVKRINIKMFSPDK